MESAARLWTLLLLSSHEEHSHLLPDSLVGVRPPKENKTFLFAKTSHCDLSGLGAEGSLGVVLPQRGTIKV